MARRGHLQVDPVGMPSRSSPLSVDSEGKSPFRASQQCMSRTGFGMRTVCNRDRHLRRYFRSLSFSWIANGKIGIASRTIRTPTAACITTTCNPLRAGFPRTAFLNLNAFPESTSNDPFTGVSIASPGQSSRTSDAWYPSALWCVALCCVFAPRPRDRQNAGVRPLRGSLEWTKTRCYCSTQHPSTFAGSLSIAVSRSWPSRRKR
jgi:hypothetical protein